jgi:hypothetical protein
MTAELRRPRPPPKTLIGIYRRFGTLGPVYEILAAGTPRPDGAPTLRIRVLESGEALEYPLAAILDDPREG